MHGIALLDGEFDDLAGDVRTDNHFYFGLHSAGGRDDLRNVAGFGFARLDERSGISRTEHTRDAPHDGESHKENEQSAQYPQQAFRSAGFFRHVFEKWKVFGKVRLPGALLRN